MRKCSLSNCSNMAKYAVDAHAYAYGHALTDRNKLPMHFSLFVCESHKDNLKVSDLITDQGWAKIQAELVSRGKCLLDRNTLKLRFRDVSAHL